MPNAFSRGLPRTTAGQRRPGSRTCAWPPFTCSPPRELRALQDKPHPWHIALSDLARRWPDPVLLTADCLAADRRPGPTSETSVAAAPPTGGPSSPAGGGEGMVVKPLANLVRGSRGLVQPGLKVRGREYLRHHLRPGLHPSGESGTAAAAASRPQALAGAARVRPRSRGARPRRPRRAAVARARVRLRRLALESEPVDPRL